MAAKYGIPQSIGQSPDTVYGDLSWLTEEVRDLALAIDARKPESKWRGCWSSKDPESIRLMKELVAAMQRGGFEDKLFLDMYSKDEELAGNPGFCIPLCHILVFVELIEREGEKK